MAAPQAGAVTPGLCGHSYAVLIQGADTSLVADGPVTGAVGVGQLTFGAGSATGCAITGGEIIYNAGDVQTSPIGVSFGPAACYGALSGLGGVPCFDGSDNITGGSLSPGGPAGTFTVAFGANYAYFDTSIVSGVWPFEFLVETTLGNSAAVGSSPADAAGVNAALPGNGAPVLGITMEKQEATAPTFAWGTAPFHGADALLCTGFGANSTDLVAAGQAAASSYQGSTMTGSYGATTGSYDIFNPTQADGELSFNSNNSYVTPGSGPVPNNSFCPFVLIPGIYLPGGGATQSIFSDGASNLAALLQASPYCDSSNPANPATAGAGYSDSSVQWGATDADAYVIVTGLLSNATGFVPAGESASCTSLEQSPVTSNIATLTSTILVAINTTKTGTVKVTNSNEAACDVEISMPTVFGGSCSLSLNGGPTVVTNDVGPSLSTVLATTTCTCGPVSSPGTVTGALTISSVACPITASAAVVCKN
ncbi:MAG: hypothetical protein WCE23_06275 [Candidatus Binatus sp.]|uniref:hypothetical protein n=1 Tax=Candidatus Binatus sp. TaxID=2811406 RepID=UPI003C793830